MKRKSLTAKKRKIKKIINNPKVNKIYKKFEDIVYKNILNKDFAIGVSGGSDSLCLAYFTKIYSQLFKNNVHVLIVNHNLRKESQKEAFKVKGILLKKRIKSKILSWNGKIPKKNIQKNARDIRYSLISDYCVKNKIEYLVTAHHLDDQIENFFIRLLRGSGLSGLASMSEKVAYSGGLRILRPLLDFKKSDLKEITLNYFKTFIEDPSNENDKFLRVRIRKYRSKMAEEGLDTSKIIKTTKNLLFAKKALNFYKNKALHKHVTFLSKNKCMLNKQIFSEEAGEIVFKLFADIFSLVSGSYYPPRSKKIFNLIKRIKATKFKKSTLGGCIIENKNNFVLISREQKPSKISFQLHK
tara:strand:+ start:2153 stop:3217 length:1065 start_codon:yes stop_codon:yes gene_type:complete